jgi:hypothetical protein
MTVRRTLLGLLLVTLSFGVPILSAKERPRLSAAFNNTVVKVDREVLLDTDGPSRMAKLIQREFGTRQEEIDWAIKQSLNWGEILTLAYIQATTGRSFAEMMQQNAGHDFWSYAEDAGMSCDKMTRSLEVLLKRAETQRNSQIFDRMRVSRRVYALPDLGSGFGLFQEALDFRRIDLPRPTKIHDGAGIAAKGEK